VSASGSADAARPKHIAHAKTVPPHPAASLAAAEKERDAYAATVGSLRTCDDLKPHVRTLSTSVHVESAMSTALGRNFSDLKLQKGEYETTPEFLERARKELSLFTGDSSRVFFFASVNEADQRYDADLEQMTVELPTAAPKSSVEGFFGDTLIRLIDSEKKTGSYVGKTNRGLKRHVDRYFAYQLFLSVSKNYFTIGDRYNNDTAVKINVARDDAIRMRGQLMLIVFGRLDTPFAARAITTHDPTVGEPYEEVYATELWKVQPRCVYLYDMGSDKFLYTYHEEAL
jgi:hypothetical protein